MTYADFSSGSCLIFPAQKSGGQIDMFLNAMVRTVTTNSEGKANGVSYIDKTENKEYKLKGKVVVLAASACSSARILLNSKSQQHPNGLGNNSDLIGKFVNIPSRTSGFVVKFFNHELMPSTLIKSEEGLLILKKNTIIGALDKNLTVWRKLDNSLSSSIFQKLKDGFKVYKGSYLIEE